MDEKNKQPVDIDGTKETDEEKEVNQEKCDS